MYTLVDAQEVGEEEACEPARSPEGTPAPVEEPADEGEESDASSGAGYHTSAEVTPARASPADEGSQAILLALSQLGQQFSALSSDVQAATRANLCSGGRGGGPYDCFVGGGGRRAGPGCVGRGARRGGSQAGTKSRRRRPGAGLSHPRA
eukprot:SAG22_NODE_372_length_11551_cov_20.656741_14_plen_150_part_00